MCVDTARYGKEQWSQQFGAFGYAYGKYGEELGDGTLLVSGSTSIEDPSGQLPYLARRTIYRLSAKDGSILTYTYYDTEPPSNYSSGRDGLMGIARSSDDNMTVSQNSLSCIILLLGFVHALLSPWTWPTLEPCLQVFVTGYVGADLGFDNFTHCYDEGQLHVTRHRLLL